MIKRRLVLAGSLVFAVCLTLLGFQLYWSTHRSILNGIDDELKYKASFLRDNFEQIRTIRSGEFPTQLPFPDLIGEEGMLDPSLIDPTTKKLMQDITVLNRPRIFDLSKKPVLVPFDVPFDNAGLESGIRGVQSIGTVSTTGRRVRVLTTPLKLNGKIALVGQVTADLTQAERALNTLKVTMLWFSPIALLASFLGGLILTSIVVRPVRRIANAAESIEATSLDQRLPVESKDEFGKLARTFNALLSRLQLAFDRQSQALELQKRFTADASHELKTPLTALKTRIGLAKALDNFDQVKVQLNYLDDIADRMKALILGLLTLARADEGKLKLELEQKPVRQLVDSALKIAVPSGGTSPEVQIESDEILLLDAPLIVQALANVIQNAISHSSPEDAVTLRCYPQGDRYHFEIIDRGPGIESNDLPHIFDRFYRSDSHRSRERGGTGLGLAIVKAIIQAHHGEITVVSKVGKGTTFVISIPKDVSPFVEN